MWEIPVQLCAKDFLRPGDVVFDVGANVGGLSIAFARLVRPGGSVHAFEPNPLLLPRLRADLDANAATEVVVVPKAAWAASGESLTLFCDDSYYASGSTVMLAVGEGKPWTRASVETISLDDYVAQTTSTPRLLKLDVEGAEYQVLRGSSRLIEEQRPIVIFEYFPADSEEHDPAEFLRERAYSLFDTNLYRSVSRAAYLQEFNRIAAVNVLAIPNEKLETSGYDRIEVKRMFTFEESLGRLSPSISLEPGRYRFDAGISGSEDTVAALRIIAASGTTLAMYEAPLWQLRLHSCSAILEVDKSVDVQCQIEPRDEKEAGITSLMVWQVLVGEAK